MATTTLTKIIGPDGTVLYQDSSGNLIDASSAGSTETYNSSDGSGQDSTIDTTIEEEDDNEYLNSIWNSEEFGFSDLESAMSSTWKLGTSAENYNDDGNLSEAIESMTDSVTGIFGLPYQFSPLVDVPAFNSEELNILANTPGASGGESKIAGNVGRKYMEKILSVMPVLFLTPGEPVYMANQSSGLADSLAGMLLDLLDTGDTDESVAEELISSEDGRFYSFTSTFPDYQRYANVGLRTLAKLMGIQNYRIPTGNGDRYVRLSKIKVEDLLNSDFKRLFGSNTTIPFYLDAETSISESFSNDTTESMLSQYANQGSDIARQIKYIMGTHDVGGLVGSLTEAGGGLSENLASALGGVGSSAGSAILGSNFINRLTSELTTVVTGGKIVFPEIWSGAQYSKSYSINMKLRSPDPDPLSIYLNIYVPIVLLMSMAAPRQIGTGANSYESPFIVRATYKSIFNCDLGIVSSLDISKGGEDKWNAMGMPMTADVTINLKDLYSTMFVSSKIRGILNNTAQLDYLALMAGVDMNHLEATRKAELAWMLSVSGIQNLPADMWGKTKQAMMRLGNRALSVIGADTRYTS